MTKSKFKNISYELWLRHFSDVIVITPPKNVTKLTSHDFSILASFQLKFLDTPLF